MVSHNYGNRLQNYALQEVLTELGNSVETLNNPWQSNYNKHLKLLKKCLKRLLFGVIGTPTKYKRTMEFDKFNHENIRFSRYWLNLKEDQVKAAAFYDLFICGSDQVWNSEAKEITGKYFATFAEEKKRASYAASFGIDHVLESRKKEFATYLNGINYISVREESGVDIVKELTDRNAECHLDPTLLLSDLKWNVIAKKPKIKDDKYIFC